MEDGDAADFEESSPSKTAKPIASVKQEKSKGSNSKAPVRSDLKAKESETPDRTAEESVQSVAPVATAIAAATHSASTIVPLQEPLTAAVTYFTSPKQCDQSKVPVEDLSVAPKSIEAPESAESQASLSSSKVKDSRTGFTPIVQKYYHFSVCSFISYLSIQNIKEISPFLYSSISISILS